MRSFFLAALSALLSVCCVPAGKLHDPSAPFDVDKAAVETVALIDGEHVYCTGVWVSDTTILTAAHCVEEHPLGDDVDYAVSANISEEKLVVLPAKLYALDKDHDLALLRSDKAHGPDHAVVSEHVFQGERVHTMGQPMGALWSYSQGVIAAVRTADIDDTEPKLWVQTTAPTSPGNSGGGLYNDAGYLVGIAHGQTRGAQNMNWYVHPKYIAAFLKMQGAL